jgi:hypothetical protein
MKTTIISSVIIAVLFLSSCNTEPEYTKLVGNWKLYEADLDSVTLDTSFVARAKKSLESSNFNFQENRNFQIVDLSFSGGSYTGVWDYSPEKKKLTLSYAGLYIDPEEYDVIKLTRRSLIIKLQIKSVGFFVYKFRKLKE